MMMQDSTIAFKNELLTFDLRDIEYNWIDVAPQIIEFNLPLPMFSNEEIREKRKDEKVFIATIFYPTGHNQSYHTYLADLAEKIYHVELNNESDSRFLLQTLYEIKDKLTPAKDLSVKHLEGFKHDFEYYKDYSIKLLNGENCENLLTHKFNKFTFWREFMPIFGGHPLQEDNYFNHNFYFKDYETGEELPIFYVTESFLIEIKMLIQNRLLIINNLIVKLKNRLGLKVASGEDDKGKVFKLIKYAKPKESKIITEFQIEMDKPRMTTTQALSNLQKRTDLGVGKKVEEPNLKSNRKYIHDKLKEFGLALKEK